MRTRRQPHDFGGENLEPNEQCHGRFVQAPDPTPAEIRQLCLAIQATWSERERRCRAGANEIVTNIEVPVIPTDASWGDG